MTARLLTIGQSADPDDAFMVWALASGAVREPGIEVRLEFTDIQALNEGALDGRLEVTAISAGAYPFVAQRYRLLRFGASFGRDYGPVVVGRRRPREIGPDTVAGLRVAVPGLHTSALLLLRIYAGDTFEAVPMRFDRILGEIEAGMVEAGLIIHEGQLTYGDRGLHLLCEPARAWHQRTVLPVPLGLVATRRDLGEEVSQKVASAFRASIETGLANPDAAISFAAEHGRGLDEARLRSFVDQYVDAATLDMGEEGLRALHLLYSQAHEAGLIPAVPPLDLLG